MQMSKEEEHFLELKQIDEDPSIKYKYHEAFKRKKNFVEEEIQRCAEIKKYNSQVMRLQKEKRRQRILDQKNRRHVDELKHATEQKISFAHMIDRHKKLNASASANSLLDSNHDSLKQLENAIKDQPQTKIDKLKL